MYKQYIPIIYKFLFLMLLLVCCVGICNRNGCQINGDVEYLNTIPFTVLSVSEDRNVILPMSCSDYDIPDINSITIIEGKIGKAVNICPPVVLSENFICDE